LWVFHLVGEVRGVVRWEGGLWRRDWGLGMWKGCRRGWQGMLAYLDF
jgi:hypothetical protein